MQPSGCLVLSFALLQSVAHKKQPRNSQDCLEPYESANNKIIGARPSVSPIISTHYASLDHVIATFPPSRLRGMQAARAIKECDSSPLATSEGDPLPWRRIGNQRSRDNIDRPRNDSRAQVVTSSFRPRWARAAIEHAVNSYM